MPFFIVGSERSGTTLLRVMLDSHPALHIPRESHFISDLLRTYSPDKVLCGTEILDAFKIVSAHRRWKEWEVNSATVLEKLRDVQSLTLADFIHLLFVEVTSREGKARWGDKTPAYVLQIDKIKRIFPNAKFIHIVRDGRDVCLSLLGRGWHGEWLRIMAERWAHTVKEGRRLGSKVGSEFYLEIGYEDLVMDSRGTLQRVCQFLNEPYSEEMLAFYERADGKVAAREAHVHKKLTRAPMSNDIERWKREMSLMQVGTIESVAGSAMDIFGQTRKFRGIARLVPAGLGFCFALADWTLPIRKKLGIHFPWLKRKF